MSRGRGSRGEMASAHGHSAGRIAVRRRADGILRAAGRSCGRARSGRDGLARGARRATAGRRLAGRGESLRGGLGRGDHLVMGDPGDARRGRLRETGAAVRRVAVHAASLRAGRGREARRRGRAGAGHGHFRGRGRLHECGRLHERGRVAGRRRGGGGVARRFARRPPWRDWRHRGGGAD